MSLTIDQILFFLNKYNFLGYNNWLYYPHVFFPNLGVSTSIISPKNNGKPFFVYDYAVSIVLLIRGFEMKIDLLEQEVRYYKQKRLSCLPDDNSNDILDTSIVSIGLSNRSIKILLNHDIRNIRNLTQVTRRDLQMMRNLGKNSIDQIVHILRIYGCGLKEKI